jgi:hypothetical protein
MATGVVLIGIFAWPLAAPVEPLTPVSLLTTNISLTDAVALGVLALLVGLLAYFLSWPYGREIGILAVPSGLAVWALWSGTVAGLMRRTAPADRHELLATLKWEPLFWLAIVAAGFVGVMLGQRIRSKNKQNSTNHRRDSKLNYCLSAAIALVASVLIAQLSIRVFAQNVTVFDPRLGSTVSQPTVRQIAFAVFVSFALAAFVVKVFLNAGYIWPIVASALVIAFVVMVYVKQDVLQNLLQAWPATFFSNAVISVSPLQMVAFGTLGSIAGFWLGIKYNYWRKYAQDA